MILVYIAAVHAAAAARGRGRRNIARRSDGFGREQTHRLAAASSLEDRRPRVDVWADGSPRIPAPGMHGLRHGFQADVSP